MNINIVEMLCAAFHKYGRGFRAFMGWDGRLACRLNDGQDARPTKHGRNFEVRVGATVFAKYCTWSGVIPPHLV
jgi:hypothetical protein